MLRISYYPGTQPWLPTSQQVDLIGTWLSAPAVVELYPRELLESIWERQNGRAMPVDSWSVRAWARKSTRTAQVFVDRTETRRSVLWLLLHELAHLELTASPLLQESVKARKDKAYLATDEGHQANPEEQFADRTATLLLPRLTDRPGQFDRLWWRNRVCRMGASSLHCNRRGR